MPHASENYVLQKNIYLKSSLISASILTPRPVLPLVVRVPNGSTHDSVKRSKVIFFPPCFTHSKMLRQSEYSCKCFQIQRLRAEEKHNEMFGLMLAIVLLFQKFQLFHQSRNNITCWLKWWIAADYWLIQQVNVRWLNLHLLVSFSAEFRPYSHDNSFPFAVPPFLSSPHLLWPVLAVGTQGQENTQLWWPQEPPSVTPSIPAVLTLIFFILPLPAERVPTFHCYSAANM